MKTLLLFLTIFVGIPAALAIAHSTEPEPETWKPKNCDRYYWDVHKDFCKLVHSGLPCQFLLGMIMTIDGEDEEKRQILLERLAQQRCAWVHEQCTPH